MRLVRTAFGVAAATLPLPVSATHGFSGLLRSE